MAVTNSQKVNSDKKLIEALRADFPQFNFAAGEDFHWNFQTQTIFFTDSPDFEAQILHELGHALNSHSDFEMDVELLQIEVEAWQTAREISQKYNIKISDNSVENHLDTYRDWLHKRSLCPNCLVNGFQQTDLSYKCPACCAVWQTNDSRFKNLRRTKK